MVVVAVVGAGPGLYLDFAALSFHTPTCGSVCADAETTNTAEIPTQTTADASDLRVLIRSSFNGLWSPVCRAGREHTTNDTPFNRGACEPALRSAPVSCKQTG